MGLTDAKTRRVNMKITCLRYSLICLIMVLISCAHSPSILKENHHSIHIAVFKNETQQYSFEERLTRAMISAFQRDGRLRIVPGSKADLELRGIVKSADVTPIGYTDLDRAIGYSMRVLIEVSVKDTASGEFLFENRPFSATGTFFLSNDLSASSTQEVTDTLAEQVLSSLIEGW